MAEKRIRVIVAKPGLDGHDRGAKVVARALRDAGFEVIYTGLRGAHNTLFPKIVELLKEKGMGDVLVIGGGVIPDADIPGLKKAGVAAVFTPGTPTSDIVNFIKENVK